MTKRRRPSETSGNSTHIELRITVLEQINAECDQLTQRLNLLTTIRQAVINDDPLSYAVCTALIERYIEKQKAKTT